LSSAAMVSTTTATAPSTRACSSADMRTRMATGGGWGRCATAAAPAW
jgi:hypothetical protein